MLPRCDFSGDIDEDLRHVRKAINERPLFLSIRGKAPHPLLLPLGHVKIAVGADREAGGGVELSVDHHARLVSLTGVLGQEHFPTDVLVGGVAGWLIGHYVFKKHSGWHVVHGL
jgi:hypothetical protein